MSRFATNRSGATTHLEVFPVVVVRFDVLFETIFLAIELGVVVLLTALEQSMRAVVRVADARGRAARSGFELLDRSRVCLLSLQSFRVLSLGLSLSTGVGHRPLPAMGFVVRYVTRPYVDVAWRRPIASLNYLLTSHVWRQDHNGFTHQDPGFIDVVVNKKADTIRVYLPPDANTLLSVTDHCLRSRHYVNVIIAGKQPAPQWLDMDAAITHCAAGLGIWTWASNDEGHDPDVVMACAGDVPTLETLAAVEILRQHVPDLKIRVINVVDLMTLQPEKEHPHGLSDEAFDALFTRDKPIIFAFHGYPYLIHRLTYRRTNHGNLHVRGYKEEGTTTTPFDMTVLNDLDRFHLAADVIDRVPGLSARAAPAKQFLRDNLAAHASYIREYGDDMSEIRDWAWGAGGLAHNR